MLMYRVWWQREENGERSNWHKVKAALILGLWPSISLSTNMPPTPVLKLTLQQSTSISKIQQGIRMSLLGFAAEENEQSYKKQTLMLQIQFQSHFKKAPTHFSLLKGPFGWWRRDLGSFSVFTPLKLPWSQCWEPGKTLSQPCRASGSPIRYG